MSISILFVDDDINLLGSFRRLLTLEREDIDFEMASSAEEAMNILRGKKYDVVVSDHRMAGMEGLTFLSIVRTKYPSMKRIMLSAQVQEDIFHEAESLAHVYLSKPCDFKILLKEIEKLLSA